MENVLNVFSSDAFSMASMTAAIQKLPLVPSRIGAMGLFGEEGVTTNTVAMEEIDGVIALLPVKRRGEAGTVLRHEKRTARVFSVPHIPHDDTILAAALQGIRAFGTQTIESVVAQVVNNHLQRMKQNHEITKEYHRIGALQGIIYDANGSTAIYNLFTEFEVTEQTTNFLLTTDSTDVRAKCIAAKRQVENALGAGVAYQHIHAFCGDTFFDQLIGHPSVADAYHRFNDSEMLRNDPRAGFTFGDITFENYRGHVGSVDFIPAAQCRIFPVGVPGLFMTYNAPADFVETVNTIGQPIYAKQELMKFGRGVEIHTQSNPLSICVKPRALVKGTNA